MLYKINVQQGEIDKNEINLTVRYYYNQLLLTTLNVVIII